MAFRKEGLLESRRQWKQKLEDTLKSVPRSDTGALDEKSKVYRVYRMARELGKIAPYLWYKECLQFLRGVGTAGRSD
jgi:hypothetical protein